MLLYNKAGLNPPAKNRMKYLILSLALMMMAPSTFAATTNSEAAQMEHFAPGGDRPNKSKAGKHGGYGKKSARHRAKGTSCKKARKIMKRRGNW